MFIVESFRHRRSTFLAWCLELVRASDTGKHMKSRTRRIGISAYHHHELFLGLGHIRSPSTGRVLIHPGGWASSITTNSFHSASAATYVSFVFY